MSLSILNKEDKSRTRKYSAKLTGNPFLFFEMRVVAGLMLSGYSEKEIREKAQEENVFQYKTRKSIKKRLNEVIRRLELLSHGIRELLAHSESDTAKLICLYAIMKSDSLFYEFMNEVLLESYYQKKPILSEDCKQFIQAKSEQSEVVHKWTVNTKKTLLEAYRTILRQSGLVRGTKSLEIQPPIFPSELSELLKENGDYVFIKAMLGDV